MAEFLVALGYHVVGCVRDIAGAERCLPEQLRAKIDLVLWDMQDQHLMHEVIAGSQPDEIYNFAAYSSGSGMYDEAVAISEVNGIAVTRMLEAVRNVNPGIRFCQASSREIFGEADESPQSESTRTNPRSPYGAAKLYADSMVRIYRQHYGLYACSAILFNHESPRRSEDFVTRKISRTAAKIKLGLEKELNLGNLNALRDWGYALDYVRAMWLMLQQKQADDYVVATGVSHSVRDFCELAFGRMGLEYRHYVKESASDYRPVEALPLVGCSDKANSELDWRPEVDFREMVHMMVDADFKNLSHNR
jgi:GDPmannose 4,6-dehydratase